METLEISSPPPSTSILHSSNEISPSILLIIIILAIIFFISGLLHLLVRFLMKPNSNNNRDPDEVGDDVTVLQGQLQQLFYLHDAGVDQSFIDTLPLFHYSSVIGVKDPFDCAVCLSEFEPDDRLRLLPKCSHAFHTQCIDTWLLSHSTCPLCRSNLLDGFSPPSRRLPVVCVLESGSDGSREMGGIAHPDEQFSASDRFDFPRKSSEVDVGDKIVTVKLGKFRNVDGSGESSTTDTNTTNNNNVVNSRRCYSMGSFAYVMDESSSLRVPIRKKPISKKPGMAASEYGADSRRDFSGIQIHGNDKPECFSISKNWVRGTAAGGAVRRTNSEIDVSNGGDELETLSCYSVESTATATSTTKRTLLWLMGRHQNKVVHTSISSSSSSNIC